MWMNPLEDIWVSQDGVSIRGFGTDPRFFESSGQSCNTSRGLNSPRFWSLFDSFHAFRPMWPARCQIKPASHPAMFRDDEQNDLPHVRTEQQRGWAHVPSNDHHDMISPTFLSSPTSTFASNAAKPQQQSQPYQSISASAMPSKGTMDQYEQEIFEVQRQKRRDVLSEWWQEILSAISSILCLVAIVVILYNVDGKPLANWTVPVSLNVVVSILSTAVKAGLILPVAECISQLKWIHLQNKKSHLEQLQVFDNASRGPAGSLQFFLKARGAPLVSYFGCLIVILALALDPFTQQIVHYSQPLGEKVPNIYSEVRHSQMYDRGPMNKTNVLSRRNDDAVMAGVMASVYGTMPDPPFSCPGFNCTFPLVTSLGVCSTCEDVTAQTQATCNDTLLTAESQNGPYSSCNYTLPSGAEIWAYAYYTSIFGVTTPDLNISLGSTTRGGNAGLDGTPGINSISIVRFDNDDENIDFEDPDQPTKWAETMTAYECNFELCAWSFEDWSMTNGILVNGSTTQSPVISDGRVLTSDDFGPEGTNFSRVYTATNPDFLGNNTFEINPLDQQAMGLTLSTIWYSGESSNGVPYFWNSAYLAGPNISQTLEDMATGITYNMMGAPSATLSRGSLLESKVFIKVRWEWLSLSIITVAGSIALLCITIWKTCAARQRAWKSSLGPLLYADSTMNGARAWGEEDKVQRKATISMGLLAASAARTPVSAFSS